jgi:transposase-like protein
VANLTDSIFNDEDSARKHLESIRWAKGRYCPHCGEAERTSAMEGESHRAGLYYCLSCKKQFSVTVGSVMERSHIPLCKWVLAFHLMSASKKGISAHQLHRMLGITYKSAWFMAHRIREAMIDTDPSPLGGYKTPVEVDETFIGNPGDVFTNDKGWSKKRGTGDKLKIVTLVERGGRARSVKVDVLTSASVGKIIKENIAEKATLMTDEAAHYKKIGKEVYRHKSVNHGAGEYAREHITTNPVEGYFSIFKRGMIGTYQHCGEQHLQRYLHEFDFRYSNRAITDSERSNLAVKGAEGKRLTYHQTHKGKAA